MNTTLTTRRNRFFRDWLFSHVIALYGGLGIAFPLIAHGITGPHGVYLNPAQFVAHTVGLLLLAYIVNYTQNRVLNRYFGPSLPRLSGFYLVALPTVFWFGYYVFYIPYDVLLGLYLLPMVSLWYKLRQVVDRPGRLLAGGLIITLVGFALAFACVLPIVPWWRATFGNRLSADMFFWCYLNTVGLVPLAGALGLFLRIHLRVPATMESEPVTGQLSDPIQS